MDDGFVTRRVDAGDRSFVISVLRFENGSFVSVSEGEPRLGAITASLGTGMTPVSTQIIPARHESLLLRLLSERLSSMARGISIVSASLKKDLSNDAAKKIMSEVVEIARDA